MAALAGCQDRHCVIKPSKERDAADPELAEFMRKVAACVRGGALT